MLLIAVAWLYVALMMAVAEATHPQGSLLGAGITFVLYGVAPLALVLYLFGTPARRRARRRAEAAAAQETAVRQAEGAAEPPPQGEDGASAVALDPDRRGHAPPAAEAGRVAAVRKEP
jgi:hypothetical protein